MTVYNTQSCSFMPYHRIVNKSNTNGTGTATPSGAHEFTLSLCNSIFSFVCMFCKSLFVLWSFVFWSLCCLFFFDIRILITHWYLQTLLYLKATQGNLECGLYEQLSSTYRLKLCIYCTICMLVIMTFFLVQDFSPDCYKE